jgi:hypothetical protein
MIFPRKAYAISRFSQSVPEPLRSTSSGYVGIIVHSAKMKSWIIFLYKK